MNQPTSIQVLGGINQQNQKVVIIKQATPIQKLTHIIEQTDNYENTI